MQITPAIGIDVGGGSAKIGVVAPDGRIEGRARVAIDAGLAAAELIDRCLDVGLTLARNSGVERIAGVGFGLPGHIDTGRGTTRLCNVAALDGFPIVAHVAARTGLAARIENDATLAALGEHRFGSGIGSARFLTVTIGTGIGVGFIVEGEPVHTSNGTLGDIGHVIVDARGRYRCRQGCCGCLESVASGAALAERYAELGTDGAAAAPEPDLRPLFERATAGDNACLAIIDTAARFLSAGIVSWLHIFAPDRIALGGGVSAPGPVLLNRVVHGVRHLAMPDYVSRFHIAAAQLGNDAGFVGAAALVFGSQEELAVT